jgi:1,4-dihydroxy-6-naphthoate synthase
MLSLGFSPCPNDTFIFDALVHGRIPAPGVQLGEVRLEDVETLNRWARDGVLDVTKVSYGVVPLLLDEYVVLRSGGALGRGCGPLVVSREGLDRERLAGCRVAIPGRNTTANLLFRLFAPDAPPGEEMPYDRIMPAVVGGEVDAGLIIHESRFTYAEQGLVSVVDLGAWWELETGAPIPLGAIVARRGLGAERIRAADEAIRASVEFALQNPEASRQFVAAHAREMTPEVTRQHIGLYVNRYSVDLGAEGEAAVRTLLQGAQRAGLVGTAHAVIRAGAD